MIVDTIDFPPLFKLVEYGTARAIHCEDNEAYLSWRSPIITSVRKKSVEHKKVIKILGKCPVKNF